MFLNLDQLPYSIHLFYLLHRLHSLHQWAGVEELALTESGIVHSYFHLKFVQFLGIIVEEVTCLL